MLVKREAASVYIDGLNEEPGVLPNEYNKLYS